MVDDRQPIDGRALRFSVVLPIYQERDTIGDLIDAIIESLGDDGRRFEIVAVDDASSDGTLKALRRARERHPDTIRVFRHLRNRGNGASLRTGIRAARGEVVVTMDADGQHDPADIIQLLAKIPPNDLVIAARTEVYKGPRHRTVANAFYNWFASWLAQTRIEDLTSGFRAMRRQAALHFLPLFPEGFSAPTTTTLAFLKAGYNVAFVPIDVGQRKGGESKIRLWRDGTRFFTIILKMIMLFDPLRIFIPTGIGLVGLGLAAWVAGLLNAGRLVFPNSTIFLFSVAVMTLLLGLISDQIASSRIHYHGDETLLALEDVDESVERQVDH